MDVQLKSRALQHVLSFTRSKSLINQDSHCNQSLILHYHTLLIRSIAPKKHIAPTLLHISICMGHQVQGSKLQKSSALCKQKGPRTMPCWQVLVKGGEGRLWGNCHPEIRDGHKILPSPKLPENRRGPKANDHLQPSIFRGFGCQFQAE